MSITSLPIEILIRVNQFLNIGDILHFASTDKFMQAILLRNRYKFYKMILRSGGFYKLTLPESTLHNTFKQMHLMCVTKNDAKYFNIPDVLTYNRDYRLVLDLFIMNQNFITLASIRNFDTKERKNTLNVACIMGHLNIVKYILQLDNSTLYTPLHYAIANNHLPIVECLLTDNIPKYNIIFKGQALQFSAQKGNYEITQYILKHGVRDFDKVMARTIAIGKNYTKIIALLS